MGFKECKDCAKRHFNCHSRCEIYLDFKRKMEKIYELRRANVIADVGPEVYMKTRDRRCERK